MRRFPWDLAVVGAIIVLLFLSQTTYSLARGPALSENLQHPALLYSCIKENVEGQIGGYLAVRSFSGPYFPKNASGSVDRTRAEYLVYTTSASVKTIQRFRLRFVARNGKQWRQFLYGDKMEFIGVEADAMEATAEILPYQAETPRKDLDLLPCWKYLGHSIESDFP